MKNFSKEILTLAEKMSEAIDKQEKLESGKDVASDRLSNLKYYTAQLFNMYNEAEGLI